MERVKGFIGEPFDTLVEIEENGVKYQVDVKMARKPDFSWTRNITVWQSRSSAKAPESWTALPIRAPLP